MNKYIIGFMLTVLICILLVHHKIKLTISLWMSLIFIIAILSFILDYIREKYFGKDD